MHSRGSSFAVRLRASFLRPLVLLSALAGVACSSNPPSATQACTDLAKAQCAQIAQCDPVTMGAEWGSDQSQCTASLAAYCVADNSFYGHGATPSSVEGCASAVRGQSCANYKESLPACKTPPGTLANGAPCSINAQCAGGVCYSPTPNQCGTCTQRSPVPAGGCYVDDDCPATQICAYAGQSSGQCIKPPTAGAPCPEGRCAAGFICGSGTTGGTGVCLSLPGKGQPCAPSIFAGNAPLEKCASGLVCANQVCTTPIWVALGDACVEGTPGSPFPSTSEACAGGSSIGGDCVADATAGSPCNGLGSPPCAPTLECINRVCVQLGTSVSCGLVGDGG